MGVGGAVGSVTRTAALRFSAHSSCDASSHPNRVDLERRGYEEDGALF